MAGKDDRRPDPEALLRIAAAEEDRGARGHLKIFFGSSAGVGKTYAMLKNARQLREQGVDVLIGLIETHGRQETAELLAGLPILPRKQVAYRGNTLEEFDLDAAIARKPAVILVDEFAHTNVPGSRHPKRWQDIEELLGQGIDVHTSLNVQHLESLNDLVGGITGIQVRETVPDRIFEAADEIVLVDLPADDLLQRLREGKVYLGDQAQRAIQNFFRKGNLIALRELALRRTADRVNDAAHSYHREAGKDRVWHTREKLLACVSPSPGSEMVLRSAGRLAASLNAEWHTVYIETPALHQQPEAVRAAAVKRLRLAQDMGSTPATISAVDVAQALVDYARKHEITKIVLGRTWRAWSGLRLRRDLPRRVQQLAPEIEILLVPQEEPQAELAPAPGGVSATRPQRLRMRERAAGMAAAVAVCAGVSLLMLPLHGLVEQTNVAMVYLLGVVVISVRYGRSPAAVAALLSVACFDVLFVPPRYSLAISDAQYAVTFAVMLGVGLLIAQLNRGLRFQVEMAGEREDRVQQLYHAARTLSGALTVEQIADIAAKGARSMLGTPAQLLVPDLADRLQAPVEQPALGIDLGIAQWAFDRATPAGVGTDTLPGSKAYYLPLKAPMRTRGVLVLALESPLAPEQLRQVETLGALLAIALERVHFVAVAQETLLKIESERLRESLLATLSHDLRTPLTALHGMAETLAQHGEEFPAELRELVAAIRLQSEGMVRLIANLLAMARLESGKNPLRMDWLALEEIVGSASRTLREALARHRFSARIPADFPLLYGDAVLIERVIVNLLENAAKYVPAGKAIWLEARVAGGQAVIEVNDEGPGLPPGREGEVFDKFMRGKPESSIPGVGLGLAICKAIVEAHGGSIRARNREGGGASFVLQLPLREAPAVGPETEVETP